MKMVSPPERGDSGDRRSGLHKRLDRWIRLQQFVYGLPDDYSYAVALRGSPGDIQCRALVSVGWMSWFGAARGHDQAHAMSLALLDSSEAWSANSGRVLLHRLSYGLWRWLLGWRRGPRVAGAESVVEERRLAG